MNLVTASVFAIFLAAMVAASFAVLRRRANRGSETACLCGCSACPYGLAGEQKPPAATVEDASSCQTCQFCKGVSHGR